MQTRRDCRKTVFYTSSFLSGARRFQQDWFLQWTIFYISRALSPSLFPSTLFFKKFNFLTESPQQFNVNIWLTASTILPILFYYSVIIVVIKAQGVRKPLQRPPTTKSSWKNAFHKHHLSLYTSFSNKPSSHKGLVKNKKIQTILSVKSLPKRAHLPCLP